MLPWGNPARYPSQEVPLVRASAQAPPHGSHQACRHQRPQDNGPQVHGDSTYPPGRKSSLPSPPWPLAPGLPTLGPSLVLRCVLQNPAKQLLEAWDLEAGRTLAPPLISCVTWSDSANPREPHFLHSHNEANSPCFPGQAILFFSYFLLSGPPSFLSPSPSILL